MIQSEKSYYKIKEEISWFIYKYADILYFQTDSFSLDLKNLVHQYKSKLKSECNVYKTTDKIKNIFKGVPFAFDLPEHPEKHNGFKDEWKYEERVMKAFGFDFSTAKFKHEKK